MPDWGDYLDQNGALNKYSSKEGFDFLSKRYFRKVRRRINYCKRLLKDHENAFLNYVLAKLYDNYDVEKAALYLYKWPTIYYCSRALEFDPHFVPAERLLQQTMEWIEFIGGDDEPFY